MKSFVTVVQNRLLNKVLLVMKLTTILILGIALQVSAAGYGQTKISLNIKKAQIAGILTAIEKQTQYRFLYNDNLSAIKQKTSVSVQNAELKQVLDMLLANTGLSYKLLDNLVIIKTATDAEEAAMVITVTGKVTGDKGEPLAGVAVKVKGTNAGVVTDAAGNYTITAADANSVLVFSYVGYQDIEVTVGNRTTVDVKLMPATSELSQVVVVGYGTQRRVDVTGSVATVKGDEIAKQSSINPVSSLQGKVAGVQITNNGAPGSSPQIRIRGLGTVLGSANPLYVVDGVWFDDISFLNPADIDNMSILKDASSQAIYGIRAANGVVLITTKKGKGKATVNYSGYVGLQKVTNQVKMANGTEYATLINEMNVAAGGTAPFNNPASFGVGTNWFDVILRDALITNHHIAVGGSSDKSSYNFSVGYLKQEGIVEGNDYTRVTARLQNDFQVGSILKIGYTAVIEGSKSNDVPGVIYKAFTAAPIVPVRYADGSYGDPADYPIGNATNNPKAQLDFYNQKSQNYRGMGNVYAELKLAQGLTLRSSIGGELGEAEVRNYNPVYFANTIQFNNNSKLSISRGQTRNWIVENTLTWDKAIKEHKFKFLVGQTAQRNKYYSLTGTADNVPYSSEGDLYLALGTGSTRTISDAGSLDTYNSYFGRVNYSFKNRYMLNASLRADGASKYYGDDRWGYFPSIGAGWVISEENFMRNQKTFNSLKLKGSWGIAGNASISSNIPVLRVSQPGSFTAIYGGQPATGASINTVVPPFLKWEKSVGLNVGIEASLLKNKLTAEIEWYSRKTTDGVFYVPILGSVGTEGSTILANQADFKNTGVEVSLGWKDNINKDWSYSINGNFSINTNKVTKVLSGDNPVFGGGAAATGGQLSTRTVNGQPIGQFFGLVVDGIFQTAAEVASSAQTSAKPGDFRYRDVNGDKVIDAKDRVVLGNPNPKYTYGLNTNLSYKEFDLTVDVQGVAGVDIYNANKGLRYGSENFSKDFYDNRWHGAGTSNTYPSANIGGGDNYKPNSWFIEDGSYIRIRNIQLGYTLPTALTNKWRMQRVRLYVNAQNALNFFSYTGFTPEVTGSPLNNGIDNGIYPLSATYNFGVNVTF